MTHYSDKRLPLEQREGEERLRWLKVENIRASAFFSEADGVQVSFVRCENCARAFSDTLKEAERKVIEGEDLLCIRCDARAELTSGIKKVVVRAIADL